VLAHGDDRATALLEAVAVGPVEALDSSFPHLPDEVVTAITQKADKAASAYAPTLRAAIGLSALGSALCLLGTKMTGIELVHTSYFDSDDVLELIVLHIVSSSGLTIDRRDGRLDEWLCSFKKCVKSNVIDGPPCA
jgi:hypothetical protein